MLIPLLLALTLCDTCTPPSPEPSPTPWPNLEQPDILVAMRDDGGVYTSPIMDVLEAGGVKFTDHTAEPLCTASRARLLTGRAPERIGGVGGAIDVDPPEDRGLPAIEDTIADYLRAVGYQTAIVGKWHLDGLPSRAERRPIAHGFDLASFAQFGWGVYTGIWFEQDEKQSDLTGLSHTSPVVTALESTWSPKIRDRALEIIDGRDPSMPLFLYVPFVGIHTPARCSAKLAGETLTTCSRRETDEALRAIVERFEANGRNAIVVVTNDNGATVDTPGLRGRKGSWWEGGVRTSTLLRAPGLAPAVISDPVAEEDWLPTLVEAAGGVLPTDRTFDGVSLWPLIRGEGPRGKGYIWRGGSYREGDLKLVGGKLYRLPDESVAIVDAPLLATMKAHNTAAKPKLGLK